MAHRWTWSAQKRHTAFWAIAEIGTPKKEGWLELDNRDGRP